jgi:hypothetical protein
MDIQLLAQLYHGFYIDAPTGNNAFSFDERSLKKIHVPSLVKGAVEDVRPGKDVVFCDIVDGVEIRAKGLKNFVHIERPGQDIFIFDNHNHAFIFWAAGIEAGVLAEGLPLVHVDQHKDMREPARWFTGSGVVEAFDYTQKELNVGNFIPPALEAGWFSRVVQVASADDFSQTLAQAPGLGTCPDPGSGQVLDIDLDIFAPIMSHIPDEVKIARLREWISRARFITMATSPFFMDQEKAAGLTRCLLEI